MNLTHKDTRIRLALWRAWRINVWPYQVEIPAHVQRMMGWM